MRTVRFKTDFDYIPHARQHVKYSAGWEGEIVEACYVAALAADALVKEPPPAPAPKDDTPQPKRQERGTRRFLQG